MLAMARTWGSVRNVALMRRGLALARSGDARAALTALRPFAGRMVDPAEAALLYRTLADAARTTGDRVDALRWLDALHSVVEAEEPPCSWLVAEAAATCGSATAVPASESTLRMAAVRPTAIAMSRAPR